MAAKTKKGHPYHLVPPSPWPLIASLSAGLFAVGMIQLMHDEGSTMLVIGVLGIIGVMFGWWRDVINEANKENQHTPTVVFGLKLGMLMFIASEVMFFAAFFWAFFNAAMFPEEATGGQWPPVGIETVGAFGLPFMMTLILLLSGVTLTWSHHALIEKEMDKAEQGLALTVLLGIVFTGVQIYEYAHAHFAFTDGIYASTFYLTTGFHGFHVIVGTVFLIVTWWQLMKRYFDGENHLGFEAAAWYWHFVDVVWLFLFVSIYWWGG